MRGLLGETRRESELAGLRRWVQAHERGLVVAWLTGTAALFAVLFVWGIWRRGFEDVLTRWNASSASRLRQAQALFDAGDFQRAAAELASLDSDHPARIVKHRLDQEREQVLELLGRSYVELDRKRRALETFDALVAFDTRNWKNHFARAEALRAFGEGDLAEAAYREVLRLHPNHHATVDALTAMLFDVATLYSKVVELHQQHIDAWLLAGVELSFGERLVRLDVPVDGRPHAFEVPLELAAGWSGEARLSTHGYSARIGALELVPARRVGIAEIDSPMRLEGDAGWLAIEAEPREPGQFAARSKAACFTRGVEAPAGAGRVRLELTLYKHMTPELWAKIETSYENRLLFDALAEVRRRTVVGGCLEAGSHFED